MRNNCPQKVGTLYLFRFLWQRPPCPDKSDQFQIGTLGELFTVKTYRQLILSLPLQYTICTILSCVWRYHSRNSHERQLLGTWSSLLLGNWWHPPINLCFNSPHLPQAQSGNAMARLPKFLQTYRKVFHVKMDKAIVPIIRKLVLYGKHAKNFREILLLISNPQKWLIEIPSQVT